MVIAARAAAFETRTILTRTATVITSRAGPPLKSRRAIGTAKAAAAFTRTARARIVLARATSAWAAPEIITAFEARCAIGTTKAAAFAGSVLARATAAWAAPEIVTAFEARCAIGTAKAAAFAGSVLTAATFARAVLTRAALTRAAGTRTVLTWTATLRCAPEIVAARAGPPLETRRAIRTTKAATPFTRGVLTRGVLTRAILARAALTRAAPWIITARAGPPFEARCTRRAALAVAIGSGRTGGAITAATRFACAITRTATRGTGSGCRRCRLGVDAKGGTRAGARRAGGRWGRRHLPLLSPPCPLAACYHTLGNDHAGTNQGRPSASGPSDSAPHGH